MDQSTPETLRRNARRCHALARSMASPADRLALDEYAAHLDQQARDLETTQHLPAPQRHN